MLPKKEKNDNVVVAKTKSAFAMHWTTLNVEMDKNFISQETLASRRRQFTPPR
jgi:hypothetical protein